MNTAGYINPSRTPAPACGRNGLRIKAAVAALFVLLCAEACGQHYIGVRGGYGNGTIRLYPPRETQALWGLYSGGVSWKYYSAERVLGGLEVDLLYMQRGYKMPDTEKPDTVTVHTLNSIQMPICFQPHVYFWGRRMRVFLNLGVTFSYNFDAWQKQYSKRDGTIYSVPYEMELPRDNNWGYGLCAGFGVNYIVHRLEFMAEARYDFGYSDLYKNHTKYAGNPLRSPIDNFTVCAGVYYRIGKGSILSPAGNKARTKMSQRDESRTARRQAAAEAAETKKAATQKAPAEEPATPPADEQQKKEINDGNDTPAQGSAPDTEGHQ